MGTETFSPYTDLLHTAEQISQEFSHQDARSFIFGFLRYILDKRDWMHVELKRMGYRPTCDYAVFPRKGKIRSDDDQYMYAEKIVAFEVYFYNLIHSEAWKLPNVTPEENNALYESRYALALALYHAFKNEYLLIP